MMDNGNSSGAPAHSTNDRVMLNVGGTLFETTVSTLESGGTDSLLAALANRPSYESEPVFIDRDPDIFSALLSLLRSNRLPSTAVRFSKQELTDEALYYGIESRLRSAMSPAQLSGIDASVVATIRPPADGVSSTFTAIDDGSVWIAHGGQVSVYDWNFSHSGTFRTHLDNITSICRAWPEVAAIGSDSEAGLHFYDFSGGRHIDSIHWTDPSDPRIYKAEVTAIANSPTMVFSSFVCSHRENCVLVIDNSTLQIVTELGRQSGSSAKSMAPGKLTWMPEMGMLIGSEVMCGAFGYSGYIRIWDPRSGIVVWETNEPGSGRSSRFGDPLAAVGVDVEDSILFKICSKSGDLAMADLRKLGDDPWVYMTEKYPSMRSTNSGGSNSVVHCYRSQVFVGREGSLEVWSSVGDRKDGELERVYRRNFVDKVEDSERGLIRKIEGGGDRLFVSRDGVEGVEVWESSYFSGASSVL